MKSSLFFATFAVDMKVNKNSLRLALINSGVMALLCIAILGLMMNNIKGLTPSIILGNGLLAFLLLIPAYYISFSHQWNKGPVFSIRRLYTPLLICLILLLPSMIYASVAFGYDWKDYYVLNGTVNVEKISTHFLSVFVPVFLLHIIQILAISNERDVIINTALLNFPRTSGSDAKEPIVSSQNSTADRDEHKLITLRGNTKTDTSLCIDISQLLYVESDANYLKLVVFENDKLQNKSIRLTIKQFEEATRDYVQLVRCHRAFVVNINHVTYFEGSANRGELHFDVISETIPVSKTYANSISDILHKGKI